ncbi:T/G mismatch-specific endonuclease [Enterobacter cloacae]|uniref:T/G mismatch-specific endonuclease n=1 Tax=Enterobacter cloacae TaxID=550 RepID=A0A377LWV3_ENTCL|nr:T/G mismatch-specific endonuclease [Enterobacter cloacae]
MLVVWECALRGRLKLNDRDLTERLEEWICGGGQTAQIDTQGIHPFTVSPPDTAPPQALAGSRYFPSVTSTTANTITPSASHSTGDSVSPPSPVPSSTATTG